MTDERQEEDEWMMEYERITKPIKYWWCEECKDFVVELTACQCCGAATPNLVCATVARAQLREAK